MSQHKIETRLSYLRNNLQRCESFLAFNDVVLLEWDEDFRQDHALFINRLIGAFKLQFVVALASIWDKTGYDYSLRYFVELAQTETVSSSTRHELSKIMIDVDEILRSGIIHKLIANRSEGFAHPIILSEQRLKAGDHFSLPTLNEYRALLGKTIEIVHDLHIVLEIPTNGELSLEDLFRDEFLSVFRSLEFAWRRKN